MDAETQAAAYIARKEKEVAASTLLEDGSDAETSEEEETHAEQSPAPRRDIASKMEMFAPPRPADFKKHCVLLHDVFTREECCQFIEVANRAFGKRRQQIVKRRNTSSVIPDNPEYIAIADELYSRILDGLPKVYKSGERTKISNWIRFLRYTQGGQLERHEDAFSVLDQPVCKVVTPFSVMVYLNENFEGGSTSLWEGYDEGDRRVDIVPREGSVLIFDHTILHAGEKVTKGLKYVLRTDAGYTFKEARAITYATKKVNGL